MAASFKDTQGREWHLRLDLGVMERFDRSSGLGVFEAMSTGRQSELLQMHHVVGLVYESIRHEAEGRKFGCGDLRAELADPRVRLDAISAMLAAIAAAFPEPKADGKEVEEGDETNPPKAAGTGAPSTE